jgi:flagellar FliL protein
MAKEEQAPVEAEGGGSKKKMFIIIGAAVAVALILGVVAFMLLGKGGKKDAPKEGAKTEAKADAHGGAAPAGGAPGVSSMYPLEPFIVNIYDGQELRYLKVKVEIEMSAAVKAELDARLAPIRDAILILLSAKTLQDIQDVQGKNQLKEEIMTALNKILPPGKIAKVYFTDFVVQ